MTCAPAFELLLFSTDVDFILPAVEAGIDGIIVDWENIGKRQRQRNYDTQINFDTIDDLRRVRRCTDVQVLCRINPFGPRTEREVTLALDEGADELLLPMVRHVSEVESVLALIDGRCDLGILIETLDAVSSASMLGRLPLSRIYVGLNDLAIERGSATIFAALADGTVENVLAALERPFGFGGLTLSDCGSPIPCRLLLGEMIRLTCSFSFLRRSFHDDIQGRDVSVEIPRLRAALTAARQRSPSDVRRQRRQLLEAIQTHQVNPQWHKTAL